VCSHWRASTADPRDAATLADRRFHPRGWVALCDGDGVRPVEDAAITFFHTATSRIRRISLPELRGQRIVGITDGLLILLDTRAAVIRVLHPFTRAAVDLPHLATFVRCVLCKQKSFSMDSVAWMNASVCVAGPGSIAVVIWLPNMPMVICAQTGSRSMGWKIIHTRVQFYNTLPFNGGLYGVTRRESGGRSFASILHMPPIRWSPKYQRSLGTPSGASTSSSSPWEQCSSPFCTNPSTRR
jgi:hypothetical protein